MQQRATPAGPATGLLSALAFANFAIGIGAFGVIGVLSPIADGLNLSHAEAGLVMSIHAAAYAVGSPLLIAATGALDRRTVIVIGMALFLAASAFCAVAPNATWLFAGRVIGALGAGMVTPVSASIAVAKSSPERRGAALSFVILGLTLAQVGGIPIGSFLGYSAGWRATFLMVAATSALALIAILFLVPRIHTPITTLATLGRTLISPVQMPAILITASMMSAVWILFTYIAPLLEATMGYGRNGVTFILVVFGVGAVIGNMAGGRIADRIGSARTLIAIAAALASILPLYSLLPISDAALGALTFAWGVIGWAFMAPQQSRIVALSPETQNVSLSLNASAIYVGAAVGSAVGGAVIDRFGFSALGIATGLAVALVLGHILFSVWQVWRRGRMQAGFGPSE
jgi:predicted MFS family arabinose efflux permease